ncbi:Glutamate 5-kinase OS=Tsukamurella paurometabola (strain ATCC 8368 / DSM / CCUG 35730 / CIP 100753 / JCM 10117 / KCTC 9821 / NBRC 16120 / NCIMB 702349 /NCTC 13040) OX=521096 GN=proB PE=3 SV=1 [Tsukamurella paurometabola]|uniref:Glutamate 5-kinase n=1 Tax=Tsukamurella paurometabola (strain ATCC 8368 / DSM 20162 / CCUG 35730 / CIP 100753 / JCM 10117 / KCTC 9821 / NBRC 16120 / NCIMB 702349 / NCTC 13040) TaxID=521096 RepID=D5UXL1_TSUPD|nr:glutamate 5-kinase [Tsukamurella paurometabola]ADG78103.1 glutamate 5-kinase [Tsukamurella paurometabola DSM 20162]SUP30188.1 Glutamate 5-kinase [Tsukamurella paurometabola]
MTAAPAADLAVGDVRAAVAGARKLVVKIGSSALTDLEHGLASDRLDALTDAIAARLDRGTEVIVVSSGAIGAGMAPLGLKRRPTDLATKQAVASVGQLQLANAWGASFRRYDRIVSLVLLTAHDVGLRVHAANAQRTLDRLRTLGAIPIINENDVVASNEVRFGDNDRLAALVAHLTGADALVLLSDVDGLYDGDPRKGDASLIGAVDGPEDLDGVVAGSGGALGTGGMASKLSAARLAADAGVPVLLTAAALADRALDGADVGTVFRPRATRLSARRFWVRHAADVNGDLVLDDGAVAAVVDRRRSLLPAGVTAVTGGFSGGDVVNLCDTEGIVRARGVVAYDASELEAMLGQGTGDLPPDMRRPVVHADDLVPVR